MGRIIAILGSALLALAASCFSVPPAPVMRADDAAIELDPDADPDVPPLACLYIEEFTGTGSDCGPYLTALQTSVSLDPHRGSDALRVAYPMNGNPGMFSCATPAPLDFSGGVQLEVINPVPFAEGYVGVQITTLAGVKLAVEIRGTNPTREVRALRDGAVIASVGLAMTPRFIRLEPRILQSAVRFLYLPFGSTLWQTVDEEAGLVNVAMVQQAMLYVTFPAAGSDATAIVDNFDACP